MNQEDLERLTGLSQGAVSKIELLEDHYENVRLGNARLLAKALGTTVDALFPPKGGAQ